MIEMYYSEKLNRYFKSKEECLSEEKEYEKYLENRQKKQQEKEAEFKFLEDEWKDVVAAFEKAEQMYRDYLKHENILKKKYHYGNCFIL